MSIAEIYETMEYGPAPESASAAHAWLEARDRQFGLYIDGLWTAIDDDRLFDSVNPANASPLARITQATADDVDRAVAAARRAFDGWSKTPGHTRASA